jgi:hypothetical protein
MPNPASRSAIPHSRSGFTVRTVGITIALVLGVAVLAVVGYLVTNSAPATTTTDPIDDVPPDIVDLLNAEGEAARGMYVQLVDSDDPTKLTGEILAESFEPIDESNRDVIAPRAWLFLNDGRSAYIEADEGRFFIPVGQNQPEEGVLRGNVRVRLFPRQPVDARPDPATTPATLTATFAEPLRFDLRLGELSTRGRVDVVGDQIEFAGSDVRAVLNQPRQRITLLEVERGEKLVYHPRAEVAATNARREPIARHAGRFGARRSGDGPEIRTVQQTGPSEPPVDLYRTVFLDGVVVEQGDRRIRADRMDIWTRLIGRQLPARGTPTPTAWTGGPVDLLLSLAVAQFAGEDLSDEPVRVTWTGRLRLNALDDRGSVPQELDGENLTLLFTAERSGLVEFEDNAAGARGTAVAARYADNARVLTLTGTAGTVGLESPGSGRIEGVSQMSVALGIGIVNVRGPGALLGADHEGDDPEGRRRAVRWTEQADFTFEVVDGSMTDRLIDARFTGRVVAHGDASELRGTVLTAEFEPADDADADQTTPRLSRLVLADADARDGRGGSMRGRDMRVWFDTGAEADTIDPTRVRVEGDVDARRNDGASIEAQMLDAALTTDDSGRILVEEVAAETDVVFGDGIDITASAQRLDARPIDERATLTGIGTSLTRGASTVTGPRIELDGVGRAIRVLGAGTLTDTAAEDGASRAIDLSWTEALTFDDLDGDALALGDVSGELRSRGEDGAYTVDRLNGSRIVLELTPGSVGDEGAQSIAGSTADRVRTALIYGDSLGSSGADAMARLETRRYAPIGSGSDTSAGTDDAEDPRGPLRRVLALDGEVIRLEAEENRLVIPGPGRLVSLDRPGERDPDQIDEGGGALPEPGAGGRVLVEWLGELVVDRAGSRVDLRNRVQVIEVREGSDVATELESEELQIIFRETDDNAGQLVSLDATGATWLRFGDRELLADRVLYDAERGIAFATSRPGNVVTLFDGQLGTPVRATRLEWDLLRDRVRIEDAAPGATGG